ncbi:MAG TPA: hypothetical protein VJ808_02780, partial [Gemmatimonadales bacterium]|nr:hypothetical protein [Gemmatimonadales bacterium]
LSAGGLPGSAWPQGLALGGASSRRMTHSTKHPTPSVTKTIVARPPTSSAAMNSVLLSEPTAPLTSRRHTPTRRY